MRRACATVRMQARWLARMADPPQHLVQQIEKTLDWAPLYFSKSLPPLVLVRMLKGYLRQCREVADD